MQLIELIYKTRFCFPWPPQFFSRRYYLNFALSWLSNRGCYDLQSSLCKAFSSGPCVCQRNTTALVVNIFRLKGLKGERESRVKKRQINEKKVVKKRQINDKVLFNWAERRGEREEGAQPSEECSRECQLCLPLCVINGCKQAISVGPLQQTLQCLPSAFPMCYKRMRCTVIMRRDTTAHKFKTSKHNSSGHTPGRMHQLSLSSFSTPKTSLKGFTGRYTVISNCFYT